MSDLSSPIIFLPGAGHNGGAPDLAASSADLDDMTRFDTISYPGWQAYASYGFSAQALIEGIVAQIVARAPREPIRIVGYSIGGHLAYAAALRLQASGREIEGFCAIDAFMVESSAPGAGWKGRALSGGLEALTKRRLGAFLRTRFWRALLRLAGSQLPRLVRKLTPSGKLPLVFSCDPIFEQELSMRLFLREVAPWVGSLDLKPVELKAPAILIRTRETAIDDPAWRRRCSNIQIFEIPGTHRTICEPENIRVLRNSFITATSRWRTLPRKTEPIS